MSEQSGSAARVSAIVYATLTVMAIAVATTAKGYIDSVGEFSFVVLVSAVGLALAHFWSQTLAQRLASNEGVTRQWLLHEAKSSGVMLVPALIMVVVALVAALFTDDVSAMTIGLIGVLVALFAYTWVGTSRRHVGTMTSFYWATGTLAVGFVMVIFKAIA